MVACAYAAEHMESYGDFELMGSPSRDAYDRDSCCVLESSVRGVVCLGVVSCRVTACLCVVVCVCHVVILLEGPCAQIRDHHHELLSLVDPFILHTV